jgi:hypothetical protein
VVDNRFGGHKVEQRSGRTVMKKVEAIIKPFKLDEVKDASPRSACRE